MVLIAIIVGIALLLLLVLAHEFGHFIVAKKAGCRVEEFGFGFPPRIASFKWHDTIYSLNLFPLGGFVKIEGENMDEVNPGPQSFASKSAWWRILILVAGVTMNVVLAIVLLSIQAGVGTPTVITEKNSSALEKPQTYIMDVTPNSPAAQAGLIALDRIVSINGQSYPTIEKIQQITREQSGSSLTLEIDRQGQRKSVQVTPRKNPPENEGPLGISLVATGLVRTPWWQAPWAGLVRTWQMLVAIITQFGLLIGRLISGASIGNEAAGPVGIALYVNEATKLGLSYVLEFGALISLNLAIINILPIPALDGGRVVFVLLEKIRRGKRIPGRVEQMTHTIGFVLLMLLMLLITFQDVKKLF